MANVAECPVADDGDSYIVFVIRQVLLDIAIVFLNIIVVTEPGIVSKQRVTDAVRGSGSEVFYVAPGSREPLLAELMKRVRVDSPPEHSLYQWFGFLKTR